MSTSKPQALSLASLPPIYVLPTHLTADELHAVEADLLAHDASLTYNALEARIFVGRVSQKKRAAFDLRARGVWTEEETPGTEEPAKKRRKLTTPKGFTSLDGHSSDEAEAESSTTANKAVGQSRQGATELVSIVKIDWLYESLKQNEIQPLMPYITYLARIIPKPPEEKSPEPIAEGIAYFSTITATSPSQPQSVSSPPRQLQTVNAESPIGKSILERAHAEAQGSLEKGRPAAFHQRRRFKDSIPTLTHPSKPPKLHRTTTSEFEGAQRSLPEPPAWVRDHVAYSCLRSTPMHTSNTAFLEQLQKIKEARLLTLDEIGVRAYSTSIAAIAAYPHVLQSEAEVLRLPGCEQKIAALWSEWQASAEEESDRYVEAVKALESDEDLKHLRIFYEIWGVGADTARRFYFDQGWKDVDDIVEFGWSTLNRVQQIGVKFYDEFQVKIPRKEVEEIADTIQRHARKCRGIEEKYWNTEQDMVVVIVGGYRRGKELCGDVDVIVSHRNEAFTKDLVIEVVASLEAEDWITHTLTLNTTTSDRHQQTLPYRGEGHGHGFDSLDKALCVWQDPSFDAEKNEKNPNIHRRVDIIVSSWRTVGCAVLGWSGATTFQRDIRRWVKREKAWKFDSSGVRDRANGLVLDLESPRKEGDGDSWLDREKRLMEGLGMGWRPAGERCTW